MDLTKKPKIYLAGPITGVRDLNKAAFAEAAAYLRSKGFEVVNPHEICARINPNDYQLLMRTCITALMQCDLILTLENWFESKGASLEVHICRVLEIPHKMYSIFIRELDGTLPERKEVQS